MKQRHVQDWAAAHVAGKSQQSLRWCQLPLGCSQSSVPLQQSGPQPPRGGSGVGLGGQRGKDTRDCGARQQHQGSLEVWPLWAQMERLCEGQNKWEWMSPVCP